MLNQTDFLITAVKNNIEGITSFIERFIQHDGRINAHHLLQIKESSDGKIAIIPGQVGDKFNNYAVLLGGEVPNSFCPLYEAAYFLQALLLSGIATILLKANLLDRYPTLNGLSPKEKARLKNEILNLSGDEIYNGIKNPLVSLIFSLDTDIEPYRYVKHQLWRLPEEALKKRCTDIQKKYLGAGKLDESLKDIYWVEEDKKIADQSIQLAENLPQAKVFQYYLTLSEILKKLDIPISNLPLYFNFVPKEEILKLGPSSEFLSALLGLFEPNSLKIYSKIVKKQSPWIISASCPNCGESSKRVISAHLKKFGQTTRLVCSVKPKIFRNEAGYKIIREGCGYTWEIPTPRNPMELYDWLKNTDFSINFAARELLAIIKTTADTPIAWPVTNIGVEVKGDGTITKIPNLPKGFGDHRELLTSILLVQKMFIEGLIAPEASNQLKQKNLLTKQEMMILGAKSFSLFDDTVLAKGDEHDSHSFVTDTSVLKMLSKGITVEEFFLRSVNLHAYSLDSLLMLREKTSF